MLTMTGPGLDGLIHQLERRRTTLMPRVARTLATQLEEGVLWARTQRLSGPPPAVLQARTGRLRATFRQETTTQGTTVVGRFGFLAPERPFWTWVQEYGATIRPRRARSLTIPLGDTLGRARDYPDTFLRGQILYQRTAGGGVIPRFLLRRQVTIPARPVLQPAWARLDPILIARLLQVAAEEG